MDKDSIKSHKSYLSWNPEMDPVTEERLKLFSKSDLDNWRRLMHIIFMNRTAPVTFSKRKIEWI
jgi:hypothetical protein